MTGHIPIEHILIGVMVYLRLMLYFVAALGFYFLATYRPLYEKRRTDAATRRMSYALSVLFVLFGWKAVAAYYQTGLLLIDSLLTPTLFLTVVFVYWRLVALHRPQAGISAEMQ